MADPIRWFTGFPTLNKNQNYINHVTWAGISALPWIVTWNSKVNGRFADEFE